MATRQVLTIIVHPGRSFSSEDEARAYAKERMAEIKELFRGRILVDVEVWPRKRQTEPND